MFFGKWDYAWISRQLNVTVKIRKYDKKSVQTRIATVMDVLSAKWEMLDITFILIHDVTSIYKAFYLTTRVFSELLLSKSRLTENPFKIRLNCLAGHFFQGHGLIIDTIP